VKWPVSPEKPGCAKLYSDTSLYQLTIAATSAPVILVEVVANRFSP
jgi:hypothetical protein